MEATHHHFCTILLVSQASPIQCGRKHSVCFQGLGPLGAILETTPSLYFFFHSAHHLLTCHIIYLFQMLIFGLPTLGCEILEGGDFDLF